MIDIQKEIDLYCERAGIVQSGSRDRVSQTEEGVPYRTLIAQVAIAAGGVAPVEGAGRIRRLVGDFLAHGTLEFDGGFV